MSAGTAGDPRTGWTAVTDWDLAPVSAQLRRMNEKDAGVPGVVAAAADEVARVVTAAVATVRAGGRVVYLGAGSAGGLAALDAAEVAPTFGVPEGTFLAVVAGDRADRPGAAADLEDDEQAGAADVAAAAVGPADLLVAVSASGRTPYTLAGLRTAAGRGARTVAVVCTRGAPLAAEADLAVVVPIGDEVVQGSTRLAAGTAQKLVLNQVSTLTMVALGHVYGDLMIEVRAENAKLRARAVRAVAIAADRSDAQASAALSAAGGDGKAAVVLLRRGLTAQAARAALDEAGGDLRAVLGERRSTPSPRVATAPRGRLRAGLEVGEASVLGVVVDAAGAVLARDLVARPRGEDALVDGLGAAVDRLAAAAGTTAPALGGTGIGLAGRDNPAAAGGPGPRVTAPLAAGVAARTGAPVVLGLAVEAAALGARHLLGLAGQDVGYLAPGTGLAAAVVGAGAVRPGRHEAERMVHLAIVADGPRCGCGQRGCLGTLASAAALDRDLAAAGLGGLDTAGVFAPDAPAAVAAVRQRFAGHLALAVRLLVLVAGVDAVVLGGPLAAVGEPLRSAVAAVLAEQAASSPFLAGFDLAGRLLVVPPDPHVAALGAALLQPPEVWS